MGPATFLRLSCFGYSPCYELTDTQARVLESLFVKLTVFPPGIKDRFTLEGFPHTVEVEVLPDAVEDGYGVFTQSLNLVNPVLPTRVSRGKIALVEGDLALHDTLDFEGLSLSFEEIRYWGEFSAVRDPGVLVLFPAFLLALIGLAMKLPGMRARGAP